MNNLPGSCSKRDRQALELMLHDGLDRLEEFTLMLAFQGSGNAFKILAITPAPTEPTVVHPQRRTENVIYLHETLLKQTA
ncbi:MAG: hypothetical protein L3J88_14645 [Gammaproteobacteria bacterium]|nr:hypothetical protein [Gammaproteobacteria bacterium]MCF6364552.1 hypothetical protein [Gammaproteobacteria bacterium]